MLDSPLSIIVHQNIADIPPAEWDAILAPGDIQASHRFIAVCQDSEIEDAIYRHVVVRHNEKIVATASFCAFAVGLDVLATGAARHFISALRGISPGLLRVTVVFCGLPVSFGRSCLRWSPDAKRDPALRMRILRELNEVALRLAQEAKAPVICFKEFNEEESALLNDLVDLNYFRAPSLPGCRLTVRWSSFDAYAAAMRAPYRRQLLASRKDESRRHLRLELVDDWSSRSAEIHALYDQVIDRAAARLERLPAAFFANLASLPQARAIIVEHQERLVAAAIVLDSERECTFLLVGIDYATVRALSTYHAVMDAVVQHALEIGAQTVELGQTSYPRKTRMGAIPTRRDLFVRGVKPAMHKSLSLMRPVLFPETLIALRRVFRDPQAETVGSGRS